MFRSILVPLDGTTFGECALPLARNIARANKAKLHLVHVHVPLAMIYADMLPNVESNLEPALRRRAEKYLETVARRLDLPDSGLTSALLEGPIADELRAEIERRQPDLVVMARHGRGPMARAWLGSVADQMVRHASVPLLLVRPPANAEEARQTAEVKRLLIPLDGSSFSEQVLAPASALAEVFKPEITLMRVVPPMVLGSAEVLESAMGQVDPVVVEKLRDLHKSELRTVEQYLENVSKPLRERGLRVTTIAASDNNAALSILEEIKTRPQDAVALATHGRGGLGRLFLGSVADKLLRASHGPVLVYRPS